MQPPPQGSGPRIAVYVSIALLLVAARIALDGSAWRGSAALHALLEALAALLALLVGALALVGFYATRRSPLLVAGVAFSGTAVLDGVHAMLAATAAEGTTTETLVGWSWFLSRTFLALMLALRLRLSEETRLAGVRVSASRTYVSVGLLMVASVALVFVLPLPEVHRARGLPRPQELVPLGLLFVALLGHLQLDAWRKDSFEDSFIVSILFGIGAQIFVPSSTASHDAMDDVAHVLKFTSYAVVLAGLLTEVFRIFRESALEHEQRTFQFLERLPVGVLVLDEHGKQHYTNAEARRLLGAGAERGAELARFSTATGAYVVGTDEPYPVEQTPMARALRGETVVTTDMELRRGEDTVALQVHGTPVRDREGELAFAIAAFQDVGELRRAALEDPLTGLPNRAALGVAFGRIRALCERNGEPLSVALLDVDRFKQVNDRYGHATGDEVLKRLADLVPGLLRGSDLLARWGGEEFALLLPRTPLEGAAKAVEKALAGFREESFGSDGATFQVTFSAGLAEVTRGDTFAGVIDAADRNLYRAKEGGRDRVCADARPVANGNGPGPR